MALTTEDIRKLFYKQGNKQDQLLGAINQDVLRPFIEACGIPPNDTDKPACLAAMIMRYYMSGTQQYSLEYTSLSKSLLNALKIHPATEEDIVNLIENYLMSKKAPEIKLVMRLSP